jgi:hypothetical protein
MKYVTEQAPAAISICLNEVRKTDRSENTAKTAPTIAVAVTPEIAEIQTALFPSPTNQGTIGTKAPKENEIKLDKAAITGLPS